MTSFRTTGQSRDLRIDALRAIAALAVLLFHVQNAWYLGFGADIAMGERMRLSDTWLGLASSPLTLGFLGLNLFFVLSGLCIHTWYLGMRERGGKFAYGAYLKRRFWRIYPAYAGAIAVSLALLVIAEWIRLERYGATAVSSYAANWVEQTLRYLTFTHTLSASTFGGYNAPLYTMAIEVHFYLAYPFVLAAIGRWGATRTLVISIGLSLAFTVAALASRDQAIQRLIFDSILVRWPEWIMGCVLAEAWFSTRRGDAPHASSLAPIYVGAACFVVALALQIATGISPNLIWSGAVALWIHAYLIRRIAPPTALEKLLARIGLFSYSIYLLHYPILRIAGLLMPPSQDALALHAFTFAGVAVTAILLARAFFAAFERPFLRTGAG